MTGAEKVVKARGKAMFLNSFGLRRANLRSLSGTRMMAFAVASFLETGRSGGLG